MSQDGINGALSDGGHYRVTAHMLEIRDSEGAVVQTIDAQDVKGANRNGSNVTINMRKGKPLTVTGATIEDAGRLTTALQPTPLVIAPSTKKRGGFGRFLMFGCGGLIALAAVVVVIAVVAAGSSKGSKTNTSNAGAAKANIASYTAGSVARSNELALTLVTISDPYTSTNQFETPKAGNRFVLYHVSATNADTREHTVNEFSFKVKGQDNHVFDPSLIPPTNAGFRATALRAGEITEGDIAFELPQDTQIVELRYDNGLGSDDLYWRK